MLPSGPCTSSAHSWAKEVASSRRWKPGPVTRRGLCGRLSSSTAASPRTPEDCASCRSCRTTCAGVTTETTSYRTCLAHLFWMKHGIFHVFSIYVPSKTGVERVPGKL